MMAYSCPIHARYIMTIGNSITLKCVFNMHNNAVDMQVINMWDIYVNMRIEFLHMPT